MTLEEFLTTTYVPLRLRGRSQNSVRLLRHAITQFNRFLERLALLTDLDDLTVSRFLMTRGSQVSPHSVARERSGIVALWNLAQARGLVALRPCVSVEVLPERTPRAFTTDELGRLADAAATARGWVGPVPAGAFFAALMAVLWETGDRINAVLSTPVVGWQRPTLEIPAAVRKGGRVTRLYTLSPETSDKVDIARRHNADTVLFWPYTSTALYARWHKITEKAGLGTGPEVQFHAIRRSTASHLAAAGLDATAALGHSSDRITRRSYLDPRVVNAGKPQVWQLLPRIGPPPAA